jgi:hypothetical protein
VFPDHHRSFPSSTITSTFQPAISGGPHGCEESVAPVLQQHHIILCSRQTQDLDTSQSSVGFTQPKGIQSCKIAAAQESQTQVSYPEHIANNINRESDEDWEMADSVLAGQMEALISHTGGELDSLLKEWVWDTER